MNSLQEVCTFYVDHLFCGVDVRDVQEIKRYQRLTAVPTAPREILGIINLRGQIVTALDLRRRFGLEDRDEGVDPMNVVVRVNGDVISLLVDQIGDVLEIDPARFEAPPDTIDAGAKELIDGVFKLEEGLLLLLNIEKTTRT